MDCHPFLLQYWEADEVARCIFAGKLESKRMTNEDSITIMAIYDDIRNQGGLKYPEAIERV